MPKKTKKETSKRLKVMVNSNAPWAPSGYGQQVRQFLPLIAKEGYKTACIAFHGLEGGIIEMDGITYYPRIGNPYGDDAMMHHGKHFNTDITISLQDIWTLNPELMHKVTRWIPIVPIDHEPTPPAIIDRLKLAYRIITYSKFGYNELKKAGLHSTYIPHTVEADIFKPLDKSKLKKEIGIPDDYYVFGMVSANKDNPPRKSFQHVMDAFKAFHDLHPKSCLYFHTLMEQSGGFPLKEYAKALGIEGSIYHTPPYEMLYLVKPEDIANIYNTFDVLLCPSLNEGFGVPIIEAQSCGVPVIANDFTAMRELVENGKTGYKVKQSELRFDPLLSYVGVPDTEDIYNSMIKLYNRSEKEVREMSDNCRNFILENYDLQLVWEKHWKPFLSRLEKEVY